MGLYEIRWEPGGVGGGGLQRCRQTTHTHPVHPHTWEIHACMCPPLTPQLSTHPIWDANEITWDFERFRTCPWGSAVGNRRFGSTNHPRNAPLFFDHVYFPNCISIFHAIFPKEIFLLKNHLYHVLLKKRKKDLHMEKGPQTVRLLH